MSRIDSDSVKEVILQNDSNSGLLSDMKDIGFDIPEGRKGEKKAYKKALMYWRISREKEFPFSKIPLRKSEKMPSTLVEENGKYYHIYGIVHGLRGTKYLSKEIKNLVRKTFHNKQMVYSEFDHSFGLNTMNIDAWDEIPLKDAAIFLSTIPSGFLLRNIAKYFSSSSYILKNISNAEKRTDYILRSREAFKRLYLPEPLTFDYFEDTYLNSIVSGRSEAMASNLLDCPEKEIQCLVGMGHEPQIEYLLKSDFGERDVYPSNLSFYKYEK